MADVTITPGAQGVQIQLTQIGEQKADLLNSLNECAAGGCECMEGADAPVESVQINDDADGITIQVHAKDGKSLDQEFIQSRVEGMLGQGVSEVSGGSCC